MNLVDQVRSYCAQVCSDLSLMSINEEILEQYSKDLLAEPRVVNISIPADDLERRRRLVLGLDSINFGSGWHDVVTKKRGLSGARSMAASLVDFETAQGPLTTRLLKSLNPAVCAKMFGQDLDNVQAMELMTHFSAAFSELAHFLDSYGSVGQLLEASDRSAVDLAARLTEMDMFDDKGFYKRAQISAADLARHGLAEFDDLASLTAFADNLVPHVLAVDGVVTLDHELAAQIDEGHLLTPGGRAETELRAVAVYVVELMTAINPTRRAMDIDQALWERGSGRSYKQSRRPRCRSVYY